MSKLSVKLLEEIKSALTEEAYQQLRSWLPTAKGKFGHHLIDGNPVCQVRFKRGKRKFVVDISFEGWELVLIEITWTYADKEITRTATLGLDVINYEEELADIIDLINSMVLETAGMFINDVPHWLRRVV